MMNRLQVSRGSHQRDYLMKRLQASIVPYESMFCYGTVPIGAAAAGLHILAH